MPQQKPKPKPLPLSNLGWEDLKTHIAKAESSGNPTAINDTNTDGTTDTGLYQVNDSHLVDDGSDLYKKIDSIFQKSGLEANSSKELKRRALLKPEVNEEIAKAIFEVQGLNAFKKSKFAVLSDYFDEQTKKKTADSTQKPTPVLKAKVTGINAQTIKEQKERPLTPKKPFIQRLVGNLETPFTKLQEATPNAPFPEARKFISKYLDIPLRSIVGGMKAGESEIGQGVSEIGQGKIGAGLLRAGLGAGEAAFGTAMGTTGAGLIFNAANQGITDVSPEVALAIARGISPLSTAVENWQNEAKETGGKPPSEITQLLARGGDLALQFALFHYGGKAGKLIFEKIKGGNHLDVDELKRLSEATQKAKVDKRLEEVQNHPLVMRQEAKNQAEARMAQAAQQKPDATSVGAVSPTINRGKFDEKGNLIARPQEVNIPQGPTQASQIVDATGKPYVSPQIELANRTAELYKNRGRYDERGNPLDQQPTTPSGIPLLQTPIPAIAGAESNILNERGEPIRTGAPTPPLAPKGKVKETKQTKKQSPEEIVDALIQRTPFIQESIRTGGTTRESMIKAFNEKTQELAEKAKKAEEKTKKTEEKKTVKAKVKTTPKAKVSEPKKSTELLTRPKTDYESLAQSLYEATTISRGERDDILKDASKLTDPKSRIHIDNEGKLWVEGKERKKNAGQVADILGKAKEPEVKPKTREEQAEADFEADTRPPVTQKPKPKPLPKQEPIKDNRVKEPPIKVVPARRIEKRAIRESLKQLRSELRDATEPKVISEKKRLIAEYEGELNKLNKKRGPMSEEDIVKSLASYGQRLKESGATDNEIKLALKKRSLEMEERAQKVDEYPAGEVKKVETVKTTPKSELTPKADASKDLKDIDEALGKVTDPKVRATLLEAKLKLQAQQAGVPGASDVKAGVAPTTELTGKTTESKPKGIRAKMSIKGPIWKAKMLDRISKANDVEADKWMRVEKTRNHTDAEIQAEYDRLAKQKAEDIIKKQEKKVVEAGPETLSQAQFNLTILKPQYADVLKDMQEGKTTYEQAKKGLELAEFKRKESIKADSDFQKLEQTAPDIAQRVLRGEVPLKDAKFALKVAEKGKNAITIKAYERGAKLTKEGVAKVFSALQKTLPEVEKIKKEFAKGQSDELSASLLDAGNKVQEMKETIKAWIDKYDPKLKDRTLTTDELLKEYDRVRQIAEKAEAKAVDLTKKELQILPETSKYLKHDIPPESEIDNSFHIDIDDPEAQKAIDQFIHAQGLGKNVAEEIKLALKAHPDNHGDILYGVAEQFGKLMQPEKHGMMIKTGDIEARNAWTRNYLGFMRKMKDALRDVTSSRSALSMVNAGVTLSIQANPNIDDKTKKYLLGLNIALGAGAIMMLSPKGLGAMAEILSSIKKAGLPLAEAAGRLRAQAEEYVKTEGKDWTDAQKKEFLDSATEDLIKNGLKTQLDMDNEAKFGQVSSDGDALKAGSFEDPDGPLTELPEITRWNRLKAWTKRTFDENLPQESNVLRKVPDSPVISDTDRMQASSFDRLHDYMKGPIGKYLREMNTSEGQLKWWNEEGKAVKYWMEHGKTKQAKEEAIAQMSKEMQEVYRDFQEEIKKDNVNRYSLGLDATPETEGPYLPRLTDEAGRDVLTLYRDGANLSKDLSTTLKSFANSRKFDTGAQGMKEGILYHSPNYAITMRKYASIKLDETAKLMRGWRGKVLFATKEEALANAPAGCKPQRMEGLPGRPQVLWATSNKAANFLRKSVRENPKEGTKIVEGSMGSLLFENAADAQKVGGEAYQVKNLVGEADVWWARSEEEARFIQQNLGGSSARSSSMMHKANQFFRNPNLMFNPLPHMTKNMLIKYGLSQGNPISLMKHLTNYTKALKNWGNVSPEVKASIEEYNQLLPHSGHDSGAGGAVEQFMTGRNLDKAMNQIQRLNWSGKTIFRWFDPGIKYARWMEYKNKGMNSQEAANNVIVDLIRYNTRSRTTDAWKAIPMNFFVPWRWGTVASLYKQIRTHPVKAAMFVGAVDYAREIRYRKTGRWVHLPWDYIEGPIAQVVERPGMTPWVAGVTALTGPGGGQAVANLREVFNDLEKGADWDRVRNMFWGVAQVYNVPHDMALAAKTGKASDVFNVFMELLTAEHSTINKKSGIGYKPLRLGGFIPEGAPFMEKSPEVRRADRLREIMARMTEMKNQRKAMRR